MRRDGGRRAAALMTNDVGPIADRPIELDRMARRVLEQASDRLPDLTDVVVATIGPDGAPFLDAARRLGWHAIGVAAGRERAELELRHHHVVDDLARLAQVGVAPQILVWTIEPMHDTVPASARHLASSIARDGVVIAVIDTVSGACSVPRLAAELERVGLSIVGRRRSSPTAMALTCAVAGA